MLLHPRTRLRRPALLAAIAVATTAPLLLGSPSASAEDGKSRSTTTDKTQLAEKRFKQARKLYSQGKYREAITKLKEAIALDPAGVELYYNLGVVNEKLQEVDDAIEAYEQYVEMVDDPREKKRVRKIIKRLQGAKHEIKSREMLPVPVKTKTVVVVKEKKVIKTVEVDRPADPGKGRLDGWVIATGSLAIVAAGAGGYFGYLALRDNNQNPTTGGEATMQSLRDRFDRSRTEAKYADIAFGAGGALAITSLVLYFARDAKPEEPPKSKVSIVPTLTTARTGAMAGVAVTF